jgi:SpoVK/Ycf46/Vps4 family AAA+-type ATPase
VSVAKFLRTDLSLTISALGPLLGLTNAEDAKKESGLDGLVLPQSVRSTLKRLLRQPPPLNKPFWVYLKGPAQSGRRTLAQALTKQFGQTLRPTCMCDGPQPGNCILVDLFSTTDEDDWANIKDHPGWIFIRPREPGLKLNLETRADLVLDLGALEPEARLHLWAGRLNDLGGQFASIDPVEMAAMDTPTGKAIEALQKVSQSGTWTDVTATAMQCRLKGLLAVSTGVAKDEQYATKVIPERTLDELCLEPEAMARFQRILQSIRGRSAMLTRWNLDPGLVGRAKGVLLFHGPSGTGKSMAAEVLAHELHLPLLRVEAAELESSPYVGETENRIHKLFASTKEKPSVLLLDEADSFLMARSNAEGSTRRYQINVVNTFLREIEQYDGLLCFTTNRADGLDAAMERRIMYRLEFLPPTKEVRKRLWESLFQKAPIPGHEELDLSTVAQTYDFTGGRTRLAFLDSLQRAAEVGRIDQRILLEACEEEHRSALPGKKSKQIRGFGSLRSNGE